MHLSNYCYYKKNNIILKKIKNKYFIKKFIKKKINKMKFFNTKLLYNIIK